MRRRRPERGFGFSLVELLVSLALMMVLGGSMASVIVIAMRSIDQTKGPSAGAALASEALATVSQDLSLAIGFRERSPEGEIPVVLDFTVPDRDGDRLDENVRYEWSGNPGDALMRTYNGVGPVEFAADVHELSLTYLTRFRKGAVPPVPPPVESETVTHARLDPGGTGTVDFGSVNVHAVYFKPSLPLNTLSWKITRVDVCIARRTTQSTGNAIIQIRNVDNGKKPTGAAVDTATIDLTKLSTGLTDVSLDFAGAGGLSPQAGMAFTIAGSQSSNHGVLLLKGGISTGSNIQYMTSASSGGSWSSPGTDKGTRFTVYGTYTTQGPPVW